MQGESKENADDRKDGSEVLNVKVLSSERSDELFEQDGQGDHQTINQASEVRQLACLRLMDFYIDKGVNAILNAFLCRVFQTMIVLIITLKIMRNAQKLSQKREKQKMT